MPTPASRFARALAEYLDHGHTQQEITDATGVSRSVISYIATGTREPARTAALDIIAGIPDRIERRTLLREWLEDNIPANCADLLRIIDADPATEPVPTYPTTEKDRAIAWLLHQLDTNIHAVHAVVDLFRAAGSPAPTAAPSATLIPFPSDTSASEDDHATPRRVISYSAELAASEPP